MRQHSTKSLWFSLCLCLLIAGCRDKELDEYYGRPDWLAAPIYQQLESKGNFKNFLACVDKAGYKQTLSGAGYFTVFAPNDDAFTKFLTEQGLSSVEDISSEMAKKIVRYSLVYNAFEKQRLSDYQSNAGWVKLDAFRRRTAYYSGVQDYTTLQDYSDLNLAGKTIKVIASNRNNNYVPNDFNNKYIPYFISDYLTKQNLTAEDYNYFFPTIPYTGFNVADASVVTADIVSENGVAHEINKVILPLPSIDEYIQDKSEYKVFKDLMEKWAVRFQVFPEVSDLYRVQTGSNEPVYVKLFVSAGGELGFAPNNENFLKDTDNDGQRDAWTMFIPTNEAVEKYKNDVLLKYGYNSLDQMPPTILVDFINAHLWPTTVWPSKFSKTSNTLGEEARFDRVADIKEAKVLSNGMLYGVNKTQDADVFRSVFGKAYLNPKYSIMTRFLQRELQSNITSPNVKVTLLLVSDSVLESKGHYFNTYEGRWWYNGSATDAVNQMNRLIQQHIIITPLGELDDLSGSGIIQNYGGEMIRFENNKIWAAGNFEAGTASAPLLNQTKVVNVKKLSDDKAFMQEAFNGKVYYLDSLLKFPTKGIGWYIRTKGDTLLADSVKKVYSKFYKFLRASSIYEANRNNTEDILGVGVGTVLTIFIPTREAIIKAIGEKRLPTINESVNPPSVGDANKETVNKFIYYHMIKGLNIVNDGKTGTYETVLKTSDGDPTHLTITHSNGVLQVVDQKGNVANVLPGIGSNVLGNRIVIHQIDKVLQY